MILWTLQVATDTRLSQLTPTSLHRILIGVYAKSMAGQHGICCLACSSSNVSLEVPSSAARSVPPGSLVIACREYTTCGVRRPIPQNKVEQAPLAAPTLLQVQAWARQMELQPAEQPKLPRRKS